MQNNYKKRFRTDLLGTRNGSLTNIFFKAACKTLHIQRLMNAHAFHIENESQWKLVSDVEILRSLLFMVFSHLVYVVVVDMWMCEWFYYNFNDLIMQLQVLILETTTKTIITIGNIDVCVCSLYALLPPTTTIDDGSCKCEVRNL